jgi:hypothetical protein
MKRHGHRTHLFRTHLGLTIAVAALLVAAVAPAFATPADQGGVRTYRVSMTNMSAGQLLSPPLLASHSVNTAVFAAGEPATEAVRTVAETGGNAQLAEALRGDPEVFQVVAADMPIHRVGGPGPSTLEATIASQGPADRLSIVMMLGCTNDGITGIDSLRLSRDFAPVTYWVGGFDAGTEENTQRWADMPDGCNALGPVAIAADGANGHPATSNGVVKMHPGITATGDLTQAHAWADPVLKIVVQRVE